MMTIPNVFQPTTKRALIIKTSSMGDVIHTLPALTDAKAALPDLVFDWVVEKNFAQIPGWHPAVNRTIEIELRKWRKAPWQSFREGKWQRFYQSLTNENYDMIIDAQGLLKSALIGIAAKGQRFGLDKNSAREPLASLFYTHRINVPKNTHAILRLRQLFSQIFGYPCPNDPPDYGISYKFTAKTEAFVVFLHGTTWETKLWPESYWQKLGCLLTEKGLNIYVPWGNPAEKARAESIAANNSKIQVLPPMELVELAKLLANAKAVVAVDTGLGHLACALAAPTVSLYGSTNPVLTGTSGLYQSHLISKFPCAPCLQEKCTYKGQSSTKPACFSEITPEMVFNQIINH